jgi:hypothetical protein
MKRRTLIAAGLLVLGVSLSSGLAAQEGPRKFYTAAIGLTQADALSVVIAPAPLRFQGPATLCQATVTVELLDALDMSVLTTAGPTQVSIGTSFKTDFTAQVGAPPARREVVVRATVERNPGRPAERGSLREMCPLLSSWQLYDVATGVTRARAEGPLGLERWMNEGIYY